VIPASSPPTRRTSSAGAPRPNRRRRPRSASTHGTLGLGPWLVAGLADAPGELLVVLWHGDEEAAQDNAERLRRTVEEGTSVVTAEPWSERLSVAAIDVAGTMVVGRLRSEVPMANDRRPAGHPDHDRRVTRAPGPPRQGLWPTPA
jgi:hypothetical protein